MPYIGFMSEKPVTRKEQAFELYIKNEDYTLEDVAREAGVLYETVRKWSKDDSWSVKKRLLAMTGDSNPDISRQAEAIRLCLYEEILGGDHTAKDKVSLVDAWRSLLGVKSEEAGFSRDALLEDTDDDATD